MTRLVTLLALVYATVIMAVVTTTVAAIDNIPPDHAPAANIAHVVDTAENAVDQFAREHGLPAVTWMDIPTGGMVTLPADCGNYAFSEVFIGFCSADRVIYMGHDLATILSMKHFLAVGLAAAHEYGHYIQLLAGASMDIGQPIEDGADCVAGVWLEWFNRTANLHLSLIDLIGLRSFISFIEKKAPDDPHGTFSDRARAIALGFLSGELDACNTYVPTV